MWKKIINNEGKKMNGEIIEGKGGEMEKIKKELVRVGMKKREEGIVKEG